MKNDIVLVRPTLELKEKALDYRKEHFQHGEEIIYGSELFDKTESYEEWLSSVTLNTKPKTVSLHGLKDGTIILAGGGRSWQMKIKRL